VFDLLDIALVHGWLVDPNLKSTAEAVGTFSYNQLVERIIENKNSKDEAVITEGQYQSFSECRSYFYSTTLFLLYCISEIRLYKCTVAMTVTYIRALSVKGF